MLSDSEKKAVIPMLLEVPIFSSLDKKGLGSIVNSAAKKTYKEGTVIAKEGETAYSFFLILNGSVQVRRANKVLAKLERGQFFGEMALLDNKPRSADVIAMEETTCILLTSWGFSGAIASNPKIAQKILAEVVNRLRLSDQALSE